MLLTRALVRKQRGRRPLAALAILGVVVATLLIAAIALAVHDLQFQLDGNVVASPVTTVGGHDQPRDWASFFDASGNKVSGALSTTGEGFTASAFKADFNTTTKKGATVFATLDATTFATGSKDTLPINPGWQCSSSNNVLSKNDIMNAYALAYTVPADDPNVAIRGHQILYFGLERNSNNGDANVAFWFLQGDVSCDSSAGTATFQGHHQDGDLLVVSAFTNGGGVSGIDVYRWNGGATGSLGTNSVGHGVDCISGGGTGGGDAICATTNGGDASTGGLNGPITTPWLTSNAGDNVGHTLQPSEFFEGGVDLTSENLGGHCFNTFVGDTRSSQSLTATIFDYALGTLGECASTTTTQAKDGAGNTLSSPVAIPATGTLAVKDTATVNVTGVSSFSGTVQFYLCGPSATSISTCSSSGTAIGSTHAITSNGSVDQTATLTSAGYYCWHAVFSVTTPLAYPARKMTVRTSASG